jgi:hypothetical protein
MILFMSQPGPYDLRGHDAEILSFLEAEELDSFTFDGLQHSLQLHPETLTRSLTRLEEEGLIQRGFEGYRTLGHGVHPAQTSGTHLLQLAQTLLPSGTSVEVLLARLRGRWFGRLRWLGYAGGVRTLKWVTIDGRVRLYARLEGPLLTIQAVLGEEAGVDEAVQASHQLLGQLSGLYAHQPPTRVASYTLYNPATAAAM